MDRSIEWYRVMVSKIDETSRYIGGVFGLVRKLSGLTARAVKIEEDGNVRISYNEEPNHKHTDLLAYVNELVKDEVGKLNACIDDGEVVGFVVGESICALFKGKDGCAEESHAI